MLSLPVYEPTHESRKYNFCFPDEKGNLWGLMYIVPLLIALKITDEELYNQFVAGENVAPLVGLLCDTQMRDDWSYGDFLSRDECYDTKKPTDSKTKRVTLKQKIADIYEAIFRNHNRYRNSAITIGEYQFTAKTKDMLLRAASGLSVYAKYE